MNNINDEYIISLFVHDGKIIPARTNKLYIEKIPEVKQYLLNRYNDTEFISYAYIIKRILNHIDNLPKCPVCGKTLIQFTNKWCNSKCQLKDPNFINYRVNAIDYKKRNIKFKNTISKRTQEEKHKIVENVNNTCEKIYGPNYKEIFKNKAANTCIEKYGVDNPWKDKEIIKKIQQAKLEKYGSICNIEKIKQTCNERYGTTSYMATEEFREKSKQTCMKKYGVNSYSKTSECRKQIKETMLNRYGVDHSSKMELNKKATHSPEANKKRIETMRKRHTFNSSSTEDKSFELLQTYFSNIKHSYSSEKYPFNCDFYIPELDLYIECNYHWTHGFHPFNENCQEDIDHLNYLKSKNTKYYNNAINTWTIRDVNKRNIAKENNLNYKEVWNYNELETWLSENFTKLDDN